MSQISVLTSYEKPSVYDTASIQEWLNTIQAETNLNKVLVLQARNDLANKDLYKAQMICVTPHATFRGWGTAKNLVSCSFQVLIDLDPKENPGVVAFKDSLADIEFVRAVWVSASGTGLALLVEVDGITSENFKTTMAALHEYFNQWGIKPDANMKSIVSKNVVGYDPEIIIKKSWKPFRFVHDTTPELRRDTYISIMHCNFYYNSNFQGRCE